MARIDLNADLGEGMGDDAAMLSLVTSANIACGAHAGDPEVMFATLHEAAARGVVIGAHPGYPDRVNFGRKVIPMEPAQAGRMIAAQIGALMGVAILAGAHVAYVKPHGALANLAADDADLAKALAAAIRAVSPDLAVLAISGTALEVAAQAAGLDVYPEIFADRGYLPNSRLVPRGQPGAMIEDPDVALSRLLRFLESGLMPVMGGDPIPLRAASICVHGDSPGAVRMARHLRQGLLAAGHDIAPFLRR